MNDEWLICSIITQKRGNPRDITFEGGASGANQPLMGMVEFECANTSY